MDKIVKVDDGYYTNEVNPLNLPDETYTLSDGEEIEND